MEKFHLDQDIEVLTFTAESFPEGIEGAHIKIQNLIKSAPARRSFGISRPEKGKIKYMAAAEQLFPNELDDSSLDKFVIVKGEYISLIVKDFRKDVASIDKAFNSLISQQGIDPEGYCIEWYLGDNDVQCMIRLRT